MATTVSFAAYSSLARKRVIEARRTPFTSQRSTVMRTSYDPCSLPGYPLDVNARRAVGHRCITRRSMVTHRSLSRSWNIPCPPTTSCPRTAIDLSTSPRVRISPVSSTALQNSGRSRVRVIVSHSIDILSRRSKVRTYVVVVVFLSTSGGRSSRTGAATTTPRPCPLRTLPRASFFLRL